MSYAIRWRVSAERDLQALPGEVRAGIMVLPVLMVAMIVVLLVASRYMQRNSSAPQQ